MKITTLISNKSLHIIGIMCLISATSHSQNNDAKSNESSREELKIEREVKVVEVQHATNRAIESSSQETPPTGFSKSSQNSSEVQAIPSDFPKYIDTGNAVQDSANYKQRKKEWIENNPSRYKAMTSNTVVKTQSSERSTPLISEKNTQ